VFGKGTEQAHEAQVLAVERVVAVAAVEDLRALGEGSCGVAQIRVTVGARRAATAGGNETEDHMVALFEPVDALANFHDDAGSFVAADHGSAGNQPGNVAVERVLVGVAQTRRGHLYEYLTPLWRVEFNLFDAPLFGAVMQYRCSCPHRVPLVGSVALATRAQQNLVPRFGL